VSKRRRHGAEFKARVVISALKGEKTTNESGGFVRGASDPDHRMEETCA